MTDRKHSQEETHSIRVSNRDWARLLIYWKSQGVDFEDRASVLRETYQTFLKEHNVREITNLEAEEIKAEETYVRRPRQKIMHEIYARANTRRIEQVRELLQTQTASSDEIRSALENLPVEEE